jgi:hypothetical protein
VVNYISKADRGVSKLLREISKDIRNGNYSLKERLRIVANTFATHSEVSAQEAACCLLQIHMTDSSRDVTFLNTGPPSERVIFVKDHEELSSMDPDSTDIAARNILDRYPLRSQAQEDICLADFAAKFNFTKIVGSKARNLKTAPLNAVWLQDLSGYVTPRTKNRVIRFRRYGEFQDPINFYREQTMLYFPWRNEETDLISCNIENKYFLNFEAISQSRLEYDPSFLDRAIEEEVSTVQLNELL